MAETAGEGAVSITLTADEALVLFEVLHRWEDDDYRGVEIADHAEQVVFWHLSCILERHLAEPFRSDYGDLLEAARARLKHEE